VLPAKLNANPNTSNGSPAMARSTAAQSMPAGQ
jgi:hypothetical protein